MMVYSNKSVQDLAVYFNSSANDKVKFMTRRISKIFLKSLTLSELLN